MYQRLQYIFAQQNWETLGNTYWIRQALDLVLASATQSALVYGMFSLLLIFSLFILYSLYFTEDGTKLPQIPAAEQGFTNGKFMDTDQSPEVIELLNTHSEFLESVNIYFSYSFT